MADAKYGPGILQGCALEGARSWHWPATLDGGDFAGGQPFARCDCGTWTWVRYGGRPYCSACARTAVARA